MVPLIYAHRGASGHFPENTMEAFRGAVAHKADGIECDVQLTLDEEIAVIHDHQLERTTNGFGLVREHTLEELRQLDAGTWFQPRFTQARIPSFAEVCAFLAETPLRLIVEMKNFFSPQPGLEEKVIELIRHYRLTERTVISSFNFESLLTIKQLDEMQSTALLYVGHLHEPWELAAQFQTEELHAPKEEITPSLLKEAKRYGLTVNAWTVNGQKQLRTFLQMGVSGVITNYPLRARKLR